jgi:hypothetical protein
MLPEDCLHERIEGEPDKSYRPRQGARHEADQSLDDVPAHGEVFEQ